MASFIFFIASCKVDRDAAYEIRMHLSSPNASPGTSATCQQDINYVNPDICFKCVKLMLIQGPETTLWLADLTWPLSKKNRQRDSESLIVPNPSTSEP